MKNCFESYFGLEDCIIAIKRNFRIDFMANANAPARSIARRGSIACDRYDHTEDENNDNENVHTTVTRIAPSRINIRRATHTGEQSVIHDFEPVDEHVSGLNGAQATEISQDGASKHDAWEEDSNCSTVDWFSENEVTIRSAGTSTRKIPNLIPAQQASQFGSGTSIPNAAIDEMALPLKGILRKVNNQQTKYPQDDNQHFIPNHMTFSQIGFPINIPPNIQQQTRPISLTNQTVSSQSGILRNLPQYLQQQPSCSWIPRENYPNSVANQMSPAQSDHSVCMPQNIPQPNIPNVRWLSQDHGGNNPNLVINQTSLSQCGIRRDLPQHFQQQSRWFPQESLTHNTNTNMFTNQMAVPQRDFFRNELFGQQEQTEQIDSDKENDENEPMPNSLYEPLQFAEWCRKIIQGIATGRNYKND